MEIDIHEQTVRQTQTLTDGFYKLQIFILRYLVKN